MKFKSYKNELIFKLIMGSLLILTIVIGTNFYISRNNLYKEYSKTQKKSTSRAVSTLKQIDVSYQIINSNMEEKMKVISEKVAKEYQRQSGNLSNEDLKKLNKKYAVSDMYLINKKGVLEKSTLEKNRGLNLVEAVGEEFAKFLNKVRNGNKMIADDLAVELGTGKLKKFTYRPTPDNKYIINLGWYIGDYNQNIDQASFQKIVDQMKEEDEFISDIRLFDVNGLRVLGNTDYEISEEHQSKIKEELIAAKSEEKELAFEKDNKKYIYKLIKLKSRDRNRVLQMVFSKKPLISQLKKQIMINVIFLIIGISITAIGAYLLSKNVIKPIKLLTNKLKKFGQGDLTISLNDNQNNEFGELARSFNQAVERQHNLISNLLDNIEDLSAYSEELSASAEEGNATIENTNQLVENISANIEEISASTEEVTSFAQESTSKTETGTKDINQTLNSINDINQAADEALEIINDLDETSKEIGGIIEMITNIAEQTNLLALNAAIEAARAGEAGQGFAVVAEEIRELSEDTNQATQKISGLIERTQNKSDNGLEAVKKVKKQADKGEGIAQETKKVFEEIKDASNQTAQQIEQTANATQDLAEKSDQVRSNTNDIKDMSIEISKSSQELSEMAQDLQRLIDKFEI